MEFVAKRMMHWIPDIRKKTAKHVGGIVIIWAVYEFQEYEIYRFHWDYLDRFE